VDRSLVNEMSNSQAVKVIHPHTTTVEQQYHKRGQNTDSLVNRSLVNEMNNSHAVKAINTHATTVQQQYHKRREKYRSFGGQKFSE
jgi:hypothetical protein